MGQERKETAPRAPLEQYQSRAEGADAFVAAYRQYCWPVNDLTDLKLAPFHLLATEEKVHTERDHRWHMDLLARVCAQDD